MVRIETQKPFIIAAAGVSRRGRPKAVPVGIVLATRIEDAWVQAINQERWWQYVLLKPRVWEKVSPKLRLEALEADRRPCKVFHLSIGILI